MNKKLLPVAVLSALAGVNAAQAVNLDPDGLGEVLLYPFYTTEGGQDTTIALVNTTMDYKAVKVRILESMNSQEVLDFNLYLSPFDHWSAVITADPDGAGAVIRSGDLTCTVPNAISDGDTIPFRNFEYSTDTINNGVERTKEGYVEVIEMGNLGGTTTAERALRTAIKHVNGVPGNCAALTAAWGPAGGFVGNPSPVQLMPPTGGLYGYGVLIDVAEGTDATYDAVALQNFFNLAVHTDPGSLDPSLGAADPTASAFDAATGAVLDLTPTSGLGIDAVSAILMSKSIANDFVLEDAISAGTDWVITFPTKRDYVNTDPNDPVIAPFTNKWSSTTTKACESISIVYYDREEQGVQPDDLDFSPAPPGPSAFALCAEANVLTFNTSNVLKASARTGADLGVIHENGWMAIDFAAQSVSTSQPDARLLAVAAGNLVGLPSVGFAVQKYVNGDLGGLLSNYAGSVTHKKAHSIQAP